MERKDNMANPKVFMDIVIAGAAAGRIVFELFADTSPKSAENFRALCTGEKGHGKSGKPLHYKGLHFHELSSGAYIWALGNKESIYGADFDDESYVNKHHKGTLSVGRFQSDKCNSGFFICLSEQSYWDGKRAAFGKIIEGMNVVQAIENCGNIRGVVIADCGQLIEEVEEEPY